MLQFSEFVWTLSYSVFNNFLLIDTTDRSKISSDQKRYFIALSLYPISFFANTPFKGDGGDVMFDVGGGACLHFCFMSFNFSAAHLISDRNS